jgi:hypothetical protein
MHTVLRTSTYIQQTSDLYTGMHHALVASLGFVVCGPCFSSDMGVTGRRARVVECAESLSRVFPGVVCHENPARS